MFSEARAGSASRLATLPPSLSPTSGRGPCERARSESRASSRSGPGAQIRRGAYVGEDSAIVASMMIHCAFEIGTMGTTVKS